VHGHAGRAVPGCAVRDHRPAWSGLQRARPERVPARPDGEGHHHLGGACPPRAREPHMTVTYADIEAAAANLGDSLVRTPTTVSHTLSEVLGCTVVVKFENLQFVASFKERGARNKLLALTDAERAAGVV